MSSWSPRQALQSVSLSLGPAWLPWIIRELRSRLNRGFMVPVRGAAVLSALQALTGDNSLKSGVVRGLECGRGDTGWKPKNRKACLTPCLTYQCLSILMGQNLPKTGSGPSGLEAPRSHGQTQKHATDRLNLLDPFCPLCLPRPCIHVKCSFFPQKSSQLALHVYISGSPYDPTNYIILYPTCHFLLKIPHDSKISFPLYFPLYFPLF